MTNTDQFYFVVSYGETGTPRDRWTPITDQISGEERPVPIMWDNGKDAADWCQSLRSDDYYRRRYGVPEGAALAVVRIARQAPSNDWQAREQERFTSGRYKPVPWASDPDAQQVPNWHFAHIAESDTQKIAFTETPEKGAADRQKVMKPGDYLQRYTNMDEVRREYYVGEVLGTNLEVKYGRTSDEIEALYIRCHAQGGAGDVHSCMAYPNGHFNSRVHPTRVYGAGDLAFAYIENESGQITARAMVWPELKRCGRIYGNQSYELKIALRRAGYGHFCYSALNGARLLKIPAEYYSENHYVMPYIDGDQSFDDAGDYFTIGGDYSAARTDGIAVMENHSECECCGDDVPDSELTEVDGDMWCRGCVSNNAFTCEHCDTITPDREANSVMYNARGYDQSWCNHCTENHAVFSERHGQSISGSLAVCCDECGEYFLPSDMHQHNESEYCGDCLESVIENETETETETEGA